MTDAHARTLSSLLDRIIPPSADGRLPGAGALGLAAHVAEAMRRAPEIELAILPGLDGAEAMAQARYGRSFHQLSEDEQRTVTEDLEASHPALMPALAFHAYVGYYQHPRIVAALGLEARPPHPQGYAMAPDDLTLLEPVRRRGKRFREA